MKVSNTTALVRVNENSQVVVDSRMIAKQFSRRHADVLLAISRLNCSEKFSQRNFVSAEYFDAQGKPRPMYTMTRDGCVFLISKLKGSEAGVFLEKYIEAFNEMEKALTSTQNTIAPYVQHTLRDIQVSNSKSVNAVLHKAGGKSAVIVYNTVNCITQSGKTPKHWKKVAQADCLPVKVSRSAKEVLRIKAPSVACGMSLSDQLVVNGVDTLESISIGKDAQHIFQRILANGVTPSELLM